MYTRTLDLRLEPFAIQCCSQMTTVSGKHICLSIFFEQADEDRFSFAAMLCFGLAVWFQSESSNNSLKDSCVKIFWETTIRIQGDEEATCEVVLTSEHKFGIGIQIFKT